MLQARSIVRFYYHKHQCYLVGEGSFIGNRGKLSVTADGGDKDLVVTPSLQRDKSVTSPNNKIQVIADVEPTQGATCTQVAAKPSLSFKPDFESGHTSSLDDDISVASIPQRLMTEEEVVTEDGKLTRVNRSTLVVVKEPSNIVLVIYSAGNYCDIWHNHNRTLFFCMQFIF